MRTSHIVLIAIVVALLLAGLVGWRQMSAQFQQLEQSLDDLEERAESAEERAAKAEASAQEASTNATVAAERAKEAVERERVSDEKAQLATEERAAALEAERQAAAARRQAEVQAEAASAAREEAERRRAETELALDETRVELDSAREETEAARRETAEAKAEAERIQAKMDRELDRMQRSLSRIADTKRTALGLVMTLDSGTIEFDFNKATLRPKNREVLSRIAGVLLTFDNFGIQIFGHTDDVGTEEANLGLSKRRAATVKAYLEEAGVDPEVMTITGMGEGAPLVTGTDPVSRQRNRRVELAIVFSEGEYEAVHDAAAAEVEAEAPDGGR
ncbi:MAG: OmpA family protein [Acidobacteriota bacterium]